MASSSEIEAKYHGKLWEFSHRKRWGNLEEKEEEEEEEEEATMLLKRCVRHICFLAQAEELKITNKTSLYNF